MSPQQYNFLTIELLVWSQCCESMRARIDVSSCFGIVLPVDSAKSYPFLQMSKIAVTRMCADLLFLVYKTVEQHFLDIDFGLHCKSEMNYSFKVFFSFSLGYTIIKIASSRLTSKIC